MMVNLNEKALQLFEENAYDEALDLLEQAVEKGRTVQSLNNLAWMYMYEEEDVQRAKPLLEEVVALRPQCHFPYNMLGEVALQEKNWDGARELLRKSIAIRSSGEAIHNLAVADFYTDRFQQAADGFHSIAEDSDIVSWYEVIARIRNREWAVAKSILDQWNSESSHYLGAIEAADAYVEMDCWQEARDKFEKEWSDYFISPNVISRYAYVLFRLHDLHACRQVIDRAVADKRVEIEEEKQEICDENWTEADKADRILELQEELSGLQQLFAKLQAGYLPVFRFELHHEGGCYLFGCKQHGHSEWVG
ncbi:tetratricopeptide repeat protein [Sporosarcina highlanderae]|uniref:Tetratricopeptide repeat protein n=1 Tax=Sporosarcina highlanderae TaxID=3035916 RepID=A0ABT8JV22_9BACL|nr:tetratricopeptide repeat protein [Sporosarcina highlanderae]MDN4608222.1 tetratricopeptide repeat protein [Sporosarcina highlanderae]